MHHGYPASDWKVFSHLRKVALERFCERILDRVDELRVDGQLSHHDRYLAIYRWLDEQDRELALAFDDPKRSQMIRQLITIRARGLLTDEEFARFTPETRQRVERLVREHSL